MSPDQQRHLFQEATEKIWNRGDTSAIDTFFAPNYVNHNPFGNTSADRDGMREAVRILRMAFPDFHSTIEDLIVEGDRLAARVTIHGTHLGELMGIAPTGRRITITAISIVRIAGDQITERWNISDTFSLLQQLGATTSVM